jgi:predicted transcriptional regulator
MDEDDVIVRVRSGEVVDKLKSRVYFSKDLEKIYVPAQTLSMTDKEIVQDLLSRVPDNASLQDIARELEFIAAVRQGLTELDNGQSVTIEEVEQELPSWIIK